jgi:hypothetical protein
VTYAAEPGETPSGRTSAGRLFGTKDKTFDILLSFDQGPAFKPPPTATSSSVTMAASSFDVASRGDASGSFDKVMGPTLRNETGKIGFGRSTKMTFWITAPQKADGYTLYLSCADAKGLSVGADEYPIPGPFSCDDASFDITYDGADVDRAFGKATFSYR